VSADVLDRLVPDDVRRARPARRWLDEHGWPTRREEAWRYAPLDSIASVVAHHDEPEERDDVLVGAQLARDIAALESTHPAWGPGAARVVLVDGRPAPDWSTAPDALAEAGLVVMCGAAPEPFEAEHPTDGFDALNLVAAPGVTVIEIGDAHEPRAVHLVHVATHPHGAAHARTRVRVGDDVTATVTETFRSSAGSGLTNAATSLELSPRARVEHVRVVAVDDGHAHVGSTSVVAHDGAHLHSSSLHLGAGAIRQSTTAHLLGEDARVTLRGLSLPRTGGHHDTDVAVHHLASGGISRQAFAAVVADGARASFGGRVFVAPGTARTDADQQCRNLLLGPTARADVRPWLEIRADDVRCSHGAAVGRLDDEAVFYLRSRGLSEREARGLLLEAFVTTQLAEHLSPGGVASWLVASALDEVPR
jgi:Fe-S cluster assembly protein SufD